MEGFTPFRCPTTVSESHLYQLQGLPFERKQIPRIVVNIRIWRKTMDSLEATRVPYKQVRSDRSCPLRRLDVTNGEIHTTYEVL